MKKDSSTQPLNQVILVFKLNQVISTQPQPLNQVIYTPPLNQVSLVFKPNIIGQIGALTINNQIVTLKYVTRLLTSELFPTTNMPESRKSSAINKSWSSIESTAAQKDGKRHHNKKITDAPSTATPTSGKLILTALAVGRS